jgi:hypothetical protein
MCPVSRQTGGADSGRGGSVFSWSTQSNFWFILIFSSVSGKNIDAMNFYSNDVTNAAVLLTRNKQYNKTLKRAHSLVQVMTVITCMSNIKTVCNQNLWPATEPLGNTVLPQTFK